MNIRLHANATTKPKIRRYVQRSQKSNRELAEELGIAISTARIWWARKYVYDRSHTRHNLLATLTPLHLTLDDLLVVVREFIHPIPRARALIAACAVHGLSRLVDRRPKDGVPTKIKPLTVYAPGYVHTYRLQVPSDAR